MRKELISIDPKVITKEQVLSMTPEEFAKYVGECDLEPIHEVREIEETEPFKGYWEEVFELKCGYFEISGMESDYGRDAQWFYEVEKKEQVITQVYYVSKK